MSAGIRQSVRHPGISDPKVVVVDATSWIVEDFFFFDVLGVFGVFFNCQLFSGCWGWRKAPRGGS